MMSIQQKETINFIGGWVAKIVVGIAAYLLVTMTNEIRSDLKSVILNQQVMQEKVRRVERVIDRMEDRAAEEQEEDKRRKR